MSASWILQGSRHPKRMSSWHLKMKVLSSKSQEPVTQWPGIISQNTLILIERRYINRTQSHLIRWLSTVCWQRKGSRYNLKLTHVDLLHSYSINWVILCTQTLSGTLPFSNMCQILTSSSSWQLIYPKHYLDNNSRNSKVSHYKIFPIMFCYLPHESKHPLQLVPVCPSGIRHISVFCVTDLVMSSDIPTDVKHCHQFFWYLFTVSEKFLLDSFDMFLHNCHYTINSNNSVYPTI